MASVMILAMTVSAAAAMFPLGAFLRDRSGGHSRAATIVQRKMEQVRKFTSKSLTYSTLKAQGIIDDASVSPASFTVADSLASELRNAQGTLELTGVGTDVVRVEVILRWTNVRGKTHQMAAATQVVNKGVWVRQ
jgi:hypothetical protein